MITSVWSVHPNICSIFKTSLPSYLSYLSNSISFFYALPHVRRQEGLTMTIGYHHVMKQFLTRVEKWKVHFVLRSLIYRAIMSNRTRISLYLYKRPVIWSHNYNLDRWEMKDDGSLYILPKTLDDIDGMISAMKKGHNDARAERQQADHPVVN
ncbi:hypothetical protein CAUPRSCDRAFT_10268 [Caulochytrium protostelioides]|uniref:Uncharacterized protein n=1 Tax=Caulochytrium protostelioides TaxID=1555241 RepID=A0A4P9X275_9FUNG|nr:hypothetical protein CAUPRSCDRAFT_10268 [Caulochytrium protostelioides]